jgi:hypothetical protein
MRDTPPLIVSTRQMGPAGQGGHRPPQHTSLSRGYRFKYDFERPPWMKEKDPGPGQYDTSARWVSGDTLSQQGFFPALLER